MTTPLSKLTAIVTRQPRSTWRWLAIIVEDGERFRVVQRAQLVRELHDADLVELARAVRSLGPRDGAIAVLEVSDAGARVAELALGARVPRIVWTNIEEPAA